MFQCWRKEGHDSTIAPYLSHFMRHHAYCRSLAAGCRFVLPLGVRCRSHHACIWCRRVVHVCTCVHDKSLVDPGKYTWQEESLHVLRIGIGYVEQS